MADLTVQIEVVDQDALEKIIKVEDARRELDKACEDLIKAVTQESGERRSDAEEQMCGTSKLETIQMEVIKAAKAVNDCADQKDVKRNRVNYGCLITWQEIAQRMGNEINTVVWEDENGCLRIPYVETGSCKTELQEKRS